MTRPAAIICAPQVEELARVETRAQGEREPAHPSRVHIDGRLSCAAASREWRLRLLCVRQIESENGEAEIESGATEESTGAKGHGAVTAQAEAQGDRRVRRQFSRENKHEILAYYYQNAKMNKYRTCKRFGISNKSLLRWISDEDKIKKARKGSKQIGSRIQVFWPDVEEQLYKEFEDTRRKGLKVKHWWLKMRSKQLMEELHPEADFKFSP